MKKQTVRTSLYCYCNSREGGGGGGFLSLKNLPFVSVLACLSLVLGLTVTSCNDSTPSLRSIDVTEKPLKLTYDVGQSLNLDGMRVDARMSDGSSYIVSHEDLSFSPAAFTEAGEAVPVTISYKGVSADPFYVKVSEPVASLVSITVIAPTKTTYNFGETLDTAGMVVTANFSDNTTQTITTGFTISHNVLNIVGTDIDVTVTYQGISGTFKITVNAIVINLLEITGVPVPARNLVYAEPTIDTAQYTGTIAWDPVIANGAIFAADIDYTATITLTAKTGYTLIGVALDSFKVAGGTASNAVNTGVVTVTFPRFDSVLVEEVKIFRGGSEVTSINNVFTVTANATLTAVLVPDDADDIAEIIYLWEVEAGDAVSIYGATDAAAAVISFDKEGTATVTVTISKGATKIDSASVEIDVSELSEDEGVVTIDINEWEFDDKTPNISGGTVSKAGIGGNPKVLQLSAGDGFDQYIWLVDGVVVTGATTKDYTFSAGGLDLGGPYFVTVRVRSGTNWYTRTVEITVAL